MKLTDNAVVLARKMFKEDNSDSLVLYTKAIEGGLTLALGAIKANDKDRVQIINGLQVIMEDKVARMLQHVEIDANDDDFVLNAECDCGEHHHDDDDCDCGCGEH